MWVAPSGVPIPEEASGAIRLEVSAEDDSGRRLLSESWPLDRTADAYRKFMKSFEPLRSWVARGRLSDADAFTARILLIHQYRRVVLRDPAVAGGAAAAGLAGGGGARTLRRNLSRRCFPRRNNGLTAMAATKTGRCRRPARSWRAASAD